MIGILSVMFFVIFGLAAVTIVLSFVRTARMSSKIFEVVERELDKPLTNSPSTASASPGKVQCGHCGSSVAKADKCPNCGAGMS